MAGLIFIFLTKEIGLGLPLYTVLGNLSLGTLILGKNRRNKINLSYAVIAVLTAFWALSLLLYARSSSSSEALAWIKIATAIYACIPVPFLYFFSVFPKEEEVPKLYQLAAWFSVATFFTLISFSDLVVKNVLVVSEGFIFIPGAAFFLFAIYFLGFYLFAFYRLTEKYYAYKGLPRQQIAYVLSGFFLGFTCSVITNLTLPLLGYSFLIGIGPLSSLITVAFISYAILKHRLMDISVVISRTVAEVLTVVFLGFGYLGLVFLYHSYISTKIDLFFLLLTILYGIFVGQSQQQIRLLFQTTADKVFLRGKYDYYNELSNVSAKIAQSLSLENILATLKQAFDNIIEVKNPRIYLSTDFDKKEVKNLLAIKELSFCQDELVLPCRLGGRLLALIVLGPKLSEDPYTGEDLKLLSMLASQTAVALDHLRMYEEMVKAQEQLLAKEEASSLGRIAAAMAHEIKNPLAAIKGLTQSIERNPRDEEIVNDFKEVVPREIERLDKLVESLAKLGQTGQPELKLVSINDLIDRTVKLFFNQCQEKGITLVKNLAAVPKVKADQEKLSQVFTNLILNAMQAMAKGGEISISTQSVAGKVIIEVSDTGQGMSEEQLKHIFEPFYSTKKGLGLGLAVTYKIIKDHGGELEVESRVGEGARFRILLC